MTATPERRIDIVTVRFQRQACERLAGEHWCVLIHPNQTSSEGPLERQGFELGGQIGRRVRVGEPGVAALVPARFIPKLEAVTLPDQHSVPLKLGELAQRGR